jgi:glycosyltransferase involved in cell wall biosynthesis
MRFLTRVIDKINWGWAAYSPKPENVLMVTEALASGGAERQMFALTYGLLQRGYNVQVFELIGTAPGQLGFASEFANIGVQLRSPSEFPSDKKRDSISRDLKDLEPFVPLLPENGAGLCRALQRVIQEFKPSIVNCWSDLSNLIGGFVSAKMHVPRIVLGQRVCIPPFWFDAHQSNLYRQAYRTLARNSGVVYINNSRSSASEHERWIELGSGTIKVVHNGFLPSSIKIRTRHDSVACRASFGLPADRPVVGGVMRFASEKDPDLWLETAAAVSAVRPDAHFLLAGYGHGAVADELFKKGAKLGLSERLVVAGVATDVGRVYGALDVHLLTSRTENIPNVMIEAQAAGIPVVGPDVGGIGEAMIGGITGIVVPERSARALAEAVLRILNTAHWRERVAVEGPKFISRKFGQERMVRETIAIYRDPDFDAELPEADTPIESNSKVAAG